MMFRALLLALLLGASGASVAATPLEAARSQANSLRERISGIRSQQMSLRQELQQVAGRIEELKSQSRGTSGDLDGSLKRSQELSSSLTGLAQSLAAAESEADGANLGLLGALGEELARVRDSLERSRDRDARAKLITQLRRLRSERDAVRVRLPAGKVPVLSTTESDDPEDLLEQADALRDSEDKIKSRIASLRNRKQELKQERELDSRMNEFLGDDGLFDEQDRRFRLRRETLTEVTTPATPAESGRVVPDNQPPGDIQAGAQFEGAPAVPDTMQDPTGRTEAPPPPQEGPRGGSSFIHQTHRATDNLPNVGRVHGRAITGGNLVDMDLDELEAEEKRLEKLAKELDGRAKSLEKRAKQLE